MVGADGKYLENTQLEPDVKVKNRYETLIKGQDEQLQKAVEILIRQQTEKPTSPESIKSPEKKSNK